jgi:cell fate (sporulation/competence/biofilm development) regulator YlbF (YheA/YmcA/DUF963 family)
MDDERRACRTLVQHRSTQRKVPQGRADEERLTDDMRSLQKFVSVHSSIYNLFNLECSLQTRENFKLNRAAALAEWRSLGAE